MTELERTRQETYDYLFLQLGISHDMAKTISDSIIRVSGYFKGRPSKVICKLESGIEVEMYL